MSCTSYWRKLFAGSVYPNWPNVLIVQARAYDTPKTIEGPTGPVTIPGVVRSDADPLRAIKRLLKARYNADAPPGHQVLMFHPAGGVTFYVIPW